MKSKLLLATTILSLIIIWGCNKTSTNDKNTNKDIGTKLSIVSDSLLGKAKVYSGGAMIVSFRKPTTTEQTITPGMRDTLISNYWNGEPIMDPISGMIKGEKRDFLMPLNGVEELFNQSLPQFKDSVVVKVTNIETPNKVQAEWMPYDSTFLAEKESNNGCSYFILGKRFVYSTDINFHFGMFKAVQDSSTLTIGKSVKKGLGTNALSVRFGKDLKSNQYHVIVNATYFYLINQVGGGGVPEPPGSSVGIPPGGN